MIAQIFAEITFIHCYLFIFKSKKWRQEKGILKKIFIRRVI